MRRKKRAKRERRKEIEVGKEAGLGETLRDREAGNGMEVER